MSLTDAQEIQALRKELTEHSHRYYVLAAPIISDQEYDAKFQRLKELEKDHPELYDANSPTQRVGSPFPTSMKAVKHAIQMLSLDNVYMIDVKMVLLG